MASFYFEDNGGVDLGMFDLVDLNPRPRFKRQSSGVVRTSKTADESTFQKFENEINKDVDLIATKTGLQTWHVFFAIFLIIAAVIGGCGWCVWRFFRKKRQSKEDKVRN